ncbi:hypothetical protein BE221DRAFT_45945, partial [Ostreococcus tauri]
GRRGEGRFLGARRGGDDGGSTAPASEPRTALERRLATRADRPRCAACGVDFTSDAQYAEHLRGKKHASKTRNASGRRGDGASGGGGRRYVKPPPGPHCELCRKMFTSETQRKEHFEGKWHAARARGELPPSNKPYS